MTGGGSRLDRAVLLVGAGVQTVGLGTALALLADLQDAYGFPTWGLGLIGGASFATSFVAYVWLARYADRGHARTMLLAASIAGVAGLAWAAFGGTLLTLVAARALFGLAEGSFVPAARRIMLDWRPARPGRELGALISATVTGFAVGPLIGAVLAEAYGLRVPFLVPAGAIALLLPFLARIQPVPITAPRARAPIGTLVATPAIWAGILLAACEFLAIGAFDAVWARLMVDRGASTALVGVSFAAFVVPVALCAPLWGRAADRFSPMAVGITAAVVSTPMLSVYGFLREPRSLILLSIVHGAVTAGIQPAAAVAVSRAAPSHLLASGQGLLEAFGFLTAAAVALPSGWAYAVLGPARLFVAVAIGSATLLLAALVAAWRRPTVLPGRV